MRISVAGGGISGLAAAYELEKARLANPEIDWHLYEAGDRLGGIVQTDCVDGFVLEGGPDGWVSEKPAARELAVELGLGEQLIASNDATRKTYILLHGALQAVPDGMRMMVPEDLRALDGSPLFSEEAKRAYAAEPGRAEELKRSAPEQDESVASFVERHFGDEVLEKVAAPLLSGVFGGDVRKLSVQAVMPAFVAMEREHGSLITALRARSVSRGTAPRPPIFTSLRRGVGSLVEALVERLPKDRVHLNSPLESVGSADERWVLATSFDATRRFLRGVGEGRVNAFPEEASSAVLAAFAWPEATFHVPQGFGFLVSQSAEASLLAATFVDQKFPHRAPEGGRILRAFFGGAGAAALEGASNETVAEAALEQLRRILGPLPEPKITTVRRWPHSLPQYAVGHLERVAALEAAMPENVVLLGNGLRGVGLPDLIAAAQAGVQRLLHA